MTYPIIYANGCSYSDENFLHGPMVGKTYAHYYRNLVGGYVLNRSRQGSCNRRIIRTTAHDMIQQRQLNPDQRIIALIQLTFEMRSELWSEDVQPLDSCESNFVTHQFTGYTNWRQKLLNNEPISDHKGFLQRWSEGRAFFYSPYAERINLLLDVLFLIKLLDSLSVEYLIFQGPQAEKLESEYLKDFFASQIAGPRVLDFESFGFCNWCYEQGFEPFNIDKNIHLAHYQPDAHQAFAEKFLTQVLP